MPYEKLCRIYTWVFVCILIFGYHPVDGAGRGSERARHHRYGQEQGQQEETRKRERLCCRQQYRNGDQCRRHILLEVAEAEAFRGLEVSHIGYLTTHLSLEELEKTGELTIWMIPAPNLLSEIVVYGNNPRVIVEEAIKKIPVNYSGNDNMLTAFYRETVQKRRRYISVSEAVMDVYKTDYNSRDVDRDKVQLLKGRRLLSQKQSDTLAVKWWEVPICPFIWTL